MKLDLYGRKSENLHLDIRNVLLSMFVPPELILNRPDGNISANVTYRENGKKNLDFKFDISQIKWSDMMIRQLVVTGNLMADSSGILESNISALLNDTSTFTLEFGLKEGTPGQIASFHFQRHSGKYRRAFNQKICKPASWLYQWRNHPDQSQ